MALHFVCHLLLLRLIPMLKELLNHVVAKDIGHQLPCVGVDLAEQLSFVVTVGCFELLLNESRTMLITTELDNVVVYILGDGQ